MYLLTEFGAILVLISFLISGKSATSGANPSWRTDIREFIKNAPVKPIVSRRESLGRPASSLWFVSDNALIATFIVRENESAPQVSHRDAVDETLPLRLRAILLDANTGKVTGTKDWPSNSRLARIVATTDGKFVTLIDNRITVYSNSFGPQQSLDLPEIGPSFFWLPHVSPSGKNILFTSNDMQNSLWVWTEVEPLKIVASSRGPSEYASISDNAVVTSSCYWGYTCTLWTVNDMGGQACTGAGSKCSPSVELRGLSGGWKTIARSEAHERPYFVSNNVILLPGKEFGKFIGLDGNLLLEEKKGHRSWGCWSTTVVTSANERRFVIPSCKWKGGSALLDVGSHPVLEKISVYDVSGTGIRSRVLDLSGPKIEDAMEFALSPDGSKLAILNNGFVQVFQLPAP